MTLPAVATHLARLRAEIGYTESPPGSNRTKYAKVAGHADGQPWCRTFIVAMAKSGGLLLPSYSAYTPTAAQAYRAAGRWHTTPQTGDEAFFDFPDSVHRIQHVGTVVDYTSKTVTTIDGNTSAGPGGSEDNGGGVFERTRSRSVVVGYGRPIYATAAAVPPPGSPFEEEDVYLPIQRVDHGRPVGGLWAWMFGELYPIASLASVQNLVNGGFVRDRSPDGRTHYEMDALQFDQLPKSSVVV